MAWMGAAYPVDGQDRVLARTSIGFDASVWELWLPLLSGATLCLTPDGLNRDPAALLDSIDTLGVTVAQFVPTLLSAACEGDAPRPRRLRPPLPSCPHPSAPLVERHIATPRRPL